MVCFSPDSQILATTVPENEGVDRYGYSAKSVPIGIRLWDAKTGESKTTLTGEHADDVISTSIESVVFSPDGRTLASVSRDEKVEAYSYGRRAARAQRVNIRLWDVETGKCKASLVGGHTSKARTLIHFSPDSRMLAAVSWDELGNDLKISGGIVCLWDVEGGQPKATLPEEHTNEVKSVVFSSNSETLVSLSEDCTIGLWDVETGKSKSTLAKEMADFQSIYFSPDKAKFASVGSDSHIRVWDMKTGNHKSTLRGPKEHMGRVTTVVFIADGRMLASGSEDGTVLLWELTE